MAYPIGASYQNPAVYPGYAPAQPPQGGMQMYQARVLGQDTYQRAYPQPAYGQPSYPQQAYAPQPMPYPQQPAYPQQAAYPQPTAYPQPGYPAPDQGNRMAIVMNSVGVFGSVIAAFMSMFRRTQAPAPQPMPPVAPQQMPQPAPQSLNPYANVQLPNRAQQSDEDFITSLYQRILGRQPDPQGYQGYVTALHAGADRHEILRAFLESDEYRARQQALLQPTPAPAPAPAPVPAPAPQPPVTMDDVKNLAREYLSQHPEIAGRPSYEDTVAVGQLRDGVIAMLNAKGYRAGRILGPDGQPYPQMIAFGNASDPMAHAYRVTAGGAAISEAITVGYCDPDIPWGDVH